MKLLFNMRRCFVTLLPLLVLSIFIFSACSSNVKDDVEGSRETKKMVWPDLPAKTRISLTSVVYKAKDLGIEKGFFRKVIDFIGGEKELQLEKPMDVVVTPDGVIYVADPGAGGVHRFNKKENEHVLLVRKDGRRMATPVGLAIGPGNSILVSDSTLGVYQIMPGQQYLTEAKLELQPRQGTGVAYDSNRKMLFVVDTLEHEVKIYNERYELIGGIGKRGVGDGEFNFPTLVWVDYIGRIYVTDSLNFRVQIFSPDGVYLRQFGKQGMGTGTQSRPKGVATDNFGHIYVVDSLFHSVQVFDYRGRFLINFGSQGAGDGQFWLPTGIFIGGDTATTIYVADPFNKRVQVFEYVGGES